MTRGPGEETSNATHAHGRTECASAGGHAAVERPAGPAGPADAPDGVCPTLTMVDDSYAAGAGAGRAPAGDQLHQQRGAGGAGRFGELSERDHGVGRPGKPGDA